MARWYIGGILKHAPSLLAFTNPTVNSYHRLVPGFEAPISLVYSQRNRSACVRIPITGSNPKAKRIEFRCPDPSANPYLAFSALLLAGLDGIQNKTEPSDPIDKDIYELPPDEMADIDQVPTSLNAVLDNLERDHEFLTAGNVFTPDLVETWIDFKRTQEILPGADAPAPARVRALLRHLTERVSAPVSSCRETAADLRIRLSRYRGVCRRFSLACVPNVHRAASTVRGRGLVRGPHESRAGGRAGGRSATSVRALGISRPRAPGTHTATERPEDGDTSGAPQGRAGGAGALIVQRSAQQSEITEICASSGDVRQTSVSSCATRARDPNPRVHLTLVTGSYAPTGQLSTSMSLLRRRDVLVVPEQVRRGRSVLLISRSRS